MLADPSLTENANVNVVFNNDEGADYPNYYIIMGNATETPLPLSSITSQIINVNASNGIFVGGSLMGSVSGDIRNQISNSNISNVSGGSVAAAGNDIGGSIYLTINGGTYHTVIGGYFIAEFRDNTGKLSIGALPMLL